jgi:c-di-GMP-binding flagellar brake protein YcgR
MGKKTADSTVVKKASSMDYSHRVTLVSYIVSLLQNLKNDRALLTVTIPGDSLECKSTVLDIQPQSGYFIIDELSPRAGHDRFVANGQCHVYGKLKGVSISFTSQLIRTGQKDGLGYYHLALPSHVDYRQRRENYRIRVGIRNAIAVTLNLPTGETVSGEMHDLSRGGMRIRFRKPAPPLQTPQIVPCQFQLPAGNTISCLVEIRRLSNDDPAHIGARFVELDRSQKRLIEQFITAQERELIKRGKRE